MSHVTPLARVISPLTHCTVKDPDTRETCGRPSDPDTSWTVCEFHGNLIAMRYADGLVDRIRGITPEWRREMELRREITQEIVREHSVVYYVDFGDTIKIGTSTRLAYRLTSLRRNTSHVLATEPGDRALESARHQQFKHLRVGSSEQFEATVELLLHIKAVRERHGDPVIPNIIGPQSTEVTRRMVERGHISSGTI